MARPLGSRKSNLLDLSFLTHDERKKLESVIKADEDLNIKDRIRLGTLRQDYEKRRFRQLQLKHISLCSCCESNLGYFWNAGVPCSSCGHKVCKNCRHKAHDYSGHIICTICEKKWVLDIQAKEYRAPSSPLLLPPPRTAQTTRISTMHSVLFKTVGPMHGSDLIKRSLLKVTMEKNSVKSQQTKHQEMPCTSSMVDPHKERKNAPFTIFSTPTRHFTHISASTPTCHPTPICTTTSMHIPTLSPSETHIPLTPATTVPIPTTAYIPRPTHTRATQTPTPTHLTTALALIPTTKSTSTQTSTAKPTPASIPISTLVPTFTPIPSPSLASTPTPASTSPVVPSPISTLTRLTTTLTYVCTSTSPPVPTITTKHTPTPKPIPTLAPPTRTPISTLPPMFTPNLTRLTSALMPILAITTTSTELSSDSDSDSDTLGRPKWTTQLDELQEPIESLTRSKATSCITRDIRLLNLQRGNNSHSGSVNKMQVLAQDDQVETPLPHANDTIKKLKNRNEITGYTKIDELTSRSCAAQTPKTTTPHTTLSTTVGHVHDNDVIKTSLFKAKIGFAEESSESSTSSSIVSQSKEKSGRHSSDSSLFPPHSPSTFSTPDIVPISTSKPSHTPTLTTAPAITDIFTGNSSHSRKSTTPSEVQSSPPSRLPHRAIHNDLEETYGPSAHKGSNELLSLQEKRKLMEHSSTRSSERYFPESWPSPSSSSRGQLQTTLSHDTKTSSTSGLHTVQPKGVESVYDSDLIKNFLLRAKMSLAEESSEESSTSSSMVCQSKEKSGRHSSDSSLFPPHSPSTFSTPAIVPISTSKPSHTHTVPAITDIFTRNSSHSRKSTPSEEVHSSPPSRLPHRAIHNDLEETYGPSAHKGSNDLQEKCKLMEHSSTRSSERYFPESWPSPSSSSRRQLQTTLSHDTKTSSTFTLHTAQPKGFESVYDSDLIKNFLLRAKMSFAEESSEESSTASSIVSQSEGKSGRHLKSSDSSLFPPRPPSKFSPPAIVPSSTSKPSHTPTLTTVPAITDIFTRNSSHSRKSTPSEVQSSPPPKQSHRAGHNDLEEKNGPSTHEASSSERYFPESLPSPSSSSRRQHQTTPCAAKTTSTTTLHTALPKTVRSVRDCEIIKRLLLKAKMEESSKESSRAFSIVGPSKGKNGSHFKSSSSSPSPSSSPLQNSKPTVITISNPTPTLTPTLTTASAIIDTFSGNSSHAWKSTPSEMPSPPPKLSHGSDHNELEEKYVPSAQGGSNVLISIQEKLKLMEHSSIPSSERYFPESWPSPSSIPKAQHQTAPHAPKTTITTTTHTAQPKTVGSVHDSDVIILNAKMEEPIIVSSATSTTVSRDKGKNGHLKPSDSFLFPFTSPSPSPKPTIITTTPTLKPTLTPTLTTAPATTDTFTRNSSHTWKWTPSEVSLIQMQSSPPTKLAHRAVHSDLEEKYGPSAHKGSNELLSLQEKHKLMEHSSIPSSERYFPESWRSPSFSSRRQHKRSPPCTAKTTTTLHTETVGSVCDNYLIKRFLLEAKKGFAEESPEETTTASSIVSQSNGKSGMHLKSSDPSLSPSPLPSPIPTHPITPISTPTTTFKPTLTPTLTTVPATTDTFTRNSSHTWKSTPSELSLIQMQSSPPSRLPHRAVYSDLEEKYGPSAHKGSNELLSLQEKMEHSSTPTSERYFPESWPSPSCSSRKQHKQSSPPPELSHRAGHNGIEGKSGSSDHEEWNEQMYLREKLKLMLRSSTPSSEKYFPESWPSPSCSSRRQQETAPHAAKTTRTSTLNTMLPTTVGPVHDRDFIKMFLLEANMEVSEESCTASSIVGQDKEQSGIHLKSSDSSLSPFSSPPSPILIPNIIPISTPTPTFKLKRISPSTQMTASATTDTFTRKSYPAWKSTPSEMHSLPPSQLSHRADHRDLEEKYGPSAHGGSNVLMSLQEKLRLMEYFSMPPSERYFPETLPSSSSSSRRQHQTTPCAVKTSRTFTLYTAHPKTVESVHDGNTIKRFLVRANVEVSSKESSTASLVVNQYRDQSWRHLKSSDSSSSSSSSSSSISIRATIPISIPTITIKHTFIPAQITAPAFSDTFTSKSTDTWKSTPTAVSYDSQMQSSPPPKPTRGTDDDLEDKYGLSARIEPSSKLSSEKYFPESSPSSSSSSKRQHKTTPSAAKITSSSTLQTVQPKTVESVHGSDIFKKSEESSGESSTASSKVRQFKEQSGRHLKTSDSSSSPPSSPSPTHAPPIILIPSHETTVKHTPSSTLTTSPEITDTVTKNSSHAWKSMPSEDHIESLILMKEDSCIAGEVLLCVQYANNYLSVFIDRVRGLAESEDRLPNPYVKVGLISDVTLYPKMKTKIIKRTKNPVYRETCKLHLEKSDFTLCYLWLCVYDWDKFGKDRFLGGIKIPLSKIDMEDISGCWYKLHEEICISHDPSSTSSSGSPHYGELRLKLMFNSITKRTDDEIRGTLHVAVLNARNLPTMDRIGQTDGYVKIYLLPDKSECGLRKTQIKRNDLNPVWDEEFTYKDVTFRELRTARVLELTVLDYDMLSENNFVGCLRLGSCHGIEKHEKWMDSNTEETGHWEQMLKETGKWVECWHSLRSYVDYGYIEFTSVPAPPSEIPKSSSPKTLGKERSFEVDPIKRKEKEVKLKEVFQHKKPPLQGIETKQEGATEDAPTTQVSRKSKKKKKTKTSESTSRTSSQTTSTMSTTELLKKKKISIQSLKGSQHLLKSTTPAIPIEHVTMSDTLSYVSSLISKTDVRESAEGISSMLASQLSSKELPSEEQQDFVISAPSSKDISLKSLVPQKESLQDHVEAQKKTRSIEGQVLLSLGYIDNHLVVYLNRAQKLAAANSGTFNPYITVYILTEDNKFFDKKTTDIKKKTLNPLFRESFKMFYPSSGSLFLMKARVSSRNIERGILKLIIEKFPIEKCDFQLFTLWLSIWDSDVAGKDNFLGGIEIPLSSIDFEQSIGRWYNLKDKDSVALLEPTPYHGKIQLKLMFKTLAKSVDDDTRGNLHITIDNAKYLPNIGLMGKTDSYVRMYLLPNKSKHGLRKTQVKRNNLNPIWNEKFVYKDISIGELKTAKVLEVAVFNCSVLSKDHILGCLRIGSSADPVKRPYEWMDSNSREAFHWEIMLKEPEKWVELVHPLRPSIDIVP